MITLIDEANYQAAISQVGSAEETDEALVEITGRISRHPESFPLVNDLGVRIASTCIQLRGQFLSISIFFTFTPTEGNLLWAFVQCIACPIAA
jgi:hypothetical protein